MDALDNWGLSRISLRKYLWKYILIYSIKSKKLSFIHLLWSCFTSAPLPLLSNRFDSLARLRLILHISKIWLIKFPFDLTELRSCNKADHQNLWPFFVNSQKNALAALFDYLNIFSPLSGQSIAVLLTSKNSSLADSSSTSLTANLSPSTAVLVPFDCRHSLDCRPLDCRLLLKPKLL